MIEILEPGLYAYWPYCRRGRGQRQRSVIPLEPASCRHRCDSVLNGRPARCLFASTEPNALVGVVDSSRMVSISWSHNSCGQLQLEPRRGDAQVEQRLRRHLFHFAHHHPTPAPMHDAAWGSCRGHTYPSACPVNAGRSAMGPSLNVRDVSARPDPAQNAGAGHRRTRRDHTRPTATVW